MELQELIETRLDGYKSRFISLLAKSENQEIKEWAQDWLNADLLPPRFGHLLVQNDLSIRTSSIVAAFMPWTYALSLFTLAYENSEAGRYEDSLNILFQIEYFLGTVAGVQKEKDRLIKRSRDSKIEPNKRAAIQFYRNPRCQNSCRVT